MWDKSDFEFEMDRLVNDVELLQRWHEEAREDDLRTGRERLRTLSLRLREKVNERLELESLPALEDEGLFPGPLPFNHLQGMMLFSGPDQLPEALDQECSKCGKPIQLESCLWRVVEQDE